MHRRPKGFRFFVIRNFNEYFDGGTGASWGTIEKMISSQNGAL